MLLQILSDIHAHSGPQVSSVLIFGADPDAEVFYDTSMCPGRSASV
jgi:hypothetical protein